MRFEEDRYELSADWRGLRKYFRVDDGREAWYHVHKGELSRMERWIHRTLLNLRKDRRRRRKQTERK